MTKTIKVAISLPLEQYRQIERARKQLRVSRSKVISEAVKHWMAQSRQREKIRAYVEGYQRAPEKAQEVKVFESLAQQAFQSEEWHE